MNSIKHLGDFLQEQLRTRHMSARAFAEFVDVSHTAINRFLDYGEHDQDIGYPSIDFLVKLAKATNTDIRYLITLVTPADVPSSTEISPDLIDLGQRIGRLPPTYRKIIEAILATGLEEEQTTPPE